MTTSLLLFVFAVALALQTVPAASQFSNGSIPYTYEAKVIESRNRTCPTEEDREAVQNEIQDEIRMLLRNITESPPTTYTCGGTSGWTRIAYLDMSNSSHQCPGDLREVTFDGIRLCARDSRADSEDAICTSVIFPTNHILYSTVCGRVVGYQFGAAAAFYKYTYELSNNTIDEYYVDGVTLTHGPVGAREHIWTFVAGLEKVPDSFHAQFSCPCAPNADPNITVPPFIRENYFCESGTIVYQDSHIFYNDTLWDGDGCPEGNSCCTFNNPPYFTRQLPASTSDDIELRDCGFYDGIGVLSGFDALIQFIELYVK